MFVSAAEPGAAEVVIALLRTTELYTTELMTISFSATPAASAMPATMVANWSLKRE